MNVLYVPAGKAAEYGDLATSPFRRCGHGCLYCYVPAMFRMKYVDFNQPAGLRTGYLERLEKDARHLSQLGDTREIVMSFTTDPYHPGDTAPTRAAIEILMRHGLRFTVLTKGGLRSTRDHDLMQEYRDKCRYGASLTLNSAQLSLKYEPQAAIPAERVQALREAKERGIITWASCEPILFPEETLAVIKRAAPWVDEFRIGALNHVETLQAHIPTYSPPSRLEMVEFVRKAHELLHARNTPVKWKDSMRPYLDLSGVQ